MSTFDVLYKRLTKTLVELRDKHGMDPERIALQAAKSAERSNRTAGRRSVGRSVSRSVGRRNRAGGSTQEKVQRVINSIMKIGSMIHRQNVQHQVGTDAIEAIAWHAEPRMTAREVSAVIRNNFDLISSSIPYEMVLYEGGYQKGKSKFHGQSKGERPGGGTSGYVKSKLIIRFRSS